MKSLDERGHNCPIPLINTIDELKKMSIGDVLIVKVDSDTPVKNITRFAESHNLNISTNKINDNEYDITITKNTNFEANENDTKCSTCSNNDFIVVISSNVMGQGDETLGKNLIKAFIFALSKQTELPNKILFYNKGAYLTTKGSESLEDLNNLKSQGVEIYTCGTCLEYYKIKQDLCVGEITNMYDIVSAMENASKVIRP